MWLQQIKRLSRTGCGDLLCQINMIEIEQMADHIVEAEEAVDNHIGKA